MPPSFTKITGTKYAYRVKRPALSKLKTQVKKLVKATKAPNVKSSKFPFGSHRRMKMKYSDIFANGIALGVPDLRAYRLNSVNDPDLTYVGHRPMGYAQVVPFFNRYRVISCSYKVTVSNAAGALTKPYIAVVATNENFAPATQNVIAESARQIKQVPLEEGTVILKGKIDLAALNGASKQQYMTDDQTEAIAGANPTENLLLTIAAYCDQACNFRYMVELWYDVEWFDPIAQGGS